MIQNCTYLLLNTKHKAKTFSEHTPMTVELWNYKVGNTLRSASLFSSCLYQLP